jgi:hypothetical protein
MMHGQQNIRNKIVSAGCAVRTEGDIFPLMRKLACPEHAKEVLCKVYRNFYYATTQSLTTVMVFVLKIFHLVGSLLLVFFKIFSVRFTRHINDACFSKIPILISILAAPGFGDPLYQRITPPSEQQRVYILVMLAGAYFGCLQVIFSLRLRI